MDNTIQLYVDKKKGKKGYPITSPDRVIDENGVNIKDYVDEAVNNAKLEGDLSDYAKKTDLHSHSNKTILDNITTSKVNQWDSKSDFSGDYNDLTNKPTIPSLNGYATEQYVNEEIKKIDVTEQLTDYAKKSELHSHNNKSVLDEITTSKVTEWNNKSTFDGNYNNLANKPTIPTKTSQLTNDSGYITSIPNEYINETELQVHTDQVLSAGEQLVLNGSQTLQNNYNFSQLTYDGSQANNSAGSLLGGVGKRQDFKTDYFFVINPNKPLYASFDIKGEVGSKAYGYVEFYDVDKQPISASHHMYQANTLTKLTQDLKNGDTVVHLEDLTNWKETLTATHQKSFIFWNYTNKQGYTYPSETYSRNMYSNLYTDSSSVNKTNNTITLSSAWNKGTIPVGTYLSQGSSGNNYKYILGGSLTITTEWKTFSGGYDGVDYTGKNDQYKLPPGTAFAKFAMFLNYNGVADEKVWITNIVVKEDMYSAVEKKADKTYVDTELAKKSDKSHTHSEYITDSELNAKGYLTEHQDISGKVDKVSGYSLVSDTEISRLETLENYDDTEVRELIDETNASLDKSVTFKVVGEGTTVPPLDNVVGNIPTKTSQLINDSGYLTSIPSEYITESEIAQLETDVNTLKTQGVQQTPIFVNTIEECADTSKIYVLPDGYIYAFMETTEEGKPTYTNLADTTSSEWLTDTRLSTSSTSNQTGTFTTNYIPCKLNDTIRIKGLDVRYYTGTSNARLHILKEDKTLAYSDCGYVPTLITNGYASISGDIITIKAGWTGNATSTSISNTAFQRFCGKLMSGYTVGDVIITVNQEIKNSETVVVKKWISTGIKFVSGNYDNEILDLQTRTSSLETSNALHESRISILESGGTSGETSQTVPSYWKSELATKEDAIQQAMEQAGRNKSAFLWYTDAHWDAGNSMMSPLLLNHIHKNTSMTKVFFGGDIIGDPTELTHNTVKHLYTNWRNKLKGLEHHSVIGNHDNIHKGRNDSNLTNTVYSFLIAPEENKNMVIGGDLYYYIDEPCEKTRYLFLDSGRFSLSDDETKFVIDTLTSVQSGWHIVVISHIWFQYTSASAPTVGSINASMQKILNVFDDYNSRKSGTVTMVSTSHSYNFASCSGKVEFCIGGHIHVDHNVFSTGGIPVILTASDVNQERSSDETEDSGVIGTVTESAVFGIIANYNEEVTKITVVGVGRGTSRVVRASNVQPQSISNITYSGDTTVGSTIDKSKFAFTINYSNSTTSTVTGANSVTPTTITTVGNNSVTITYVENGITLTATTIIVGTAKTTVNLFDKNDSDLVDTARFNSSNNAVAYQQGQLATGFIEGQIGDTFTIKSDKSQLTNGYTGTIMLYNASKTPIVGWINQATADGGWTWTSDGLSGTITIPSSYSNTSHAGTTFVRFCIAYTNIDSIVITKS